MCLLEVGAKEGVDWVVEVTPDSEGVAKAEGWRDWRRDRCYRARSRGCLYRDSLRPLQGSVHPQGERHCTSQSAPRASTSDKSMARGLKQAGKRSKP
eukprot:scaffold306_cov525-Prasinococcus_capsulatus_cf.AAC.48